MVARTPSGGVKASARRQAKAKGHTLPGTDKFPINNLRDLANAKHDIGRTNEPKAKVVAFINSRASALGGKPVGGGRPGPKAKHHFAHGKPRA